MTVPLWESELPYTLTDDGVMVIRRKVFAQEYFDYKAGEHVVFGGPSTRGKTTLAFDLLGPIATPKLPVFVAVSKPSDPVTEKRGRELGFRVVQDWPPPPRLKELRMFGGEAPRGYLIWPPFGDLENDMERCAEVTGKLIMDRYSHGASRKNTGGILVMDDTMVKAKIMGLDSHMVTILAMAGAMDLGLWIFVQRPSDSGRTALWGYENAKHLFFTKSGDQQMLKRYAEVAGENGKALMTILPRLREFQFMYINKVEGYVCIVDSR